MAAVVAQFEVLEPEIEQRAHLRIQPHFRQRIGRAGELGLYLIQVVQIQVRIAQGVNERSRAQIADLGNHQGQQGIGGDVEGHAQKHVGTALVELAGQPALGDVELEKGVAGRQRHALDLADVPGADDQAAGIRVAPDLLHDLLHLIDAAPVRRPPGAPLGAVDGPQIAVLVRPFVPDADPMLAQVADVGIAAQKPQQFVDDRLEMQLLGGYRREAFAQVEAHLMAENAERARAGTIALAGALLPDPAQEFEVLLHRTAPPPAGPR